MSLLADDDHGPGLRVAQSEIGAVTVCPCGVVTLTMQYLSLRLEPGAFRSLAQMIVQAQTRIDRFGGPAEGADAAASACNDTAADDASPAIAPQRCVH